MCGLFGFTSYGAPVKGITGLTNTLAEYSAIRGTDATGIAYCTKQIHINKEGKSAYAMNFKVPENVKTAVKTDLHGRAIEECAVKDGTVTVKLRKFEIVTLKFQ